MIVVIFLLAQQNQSTSSSQNFCCYVIIRPFLTLIKGISFYRNCGAVSVGQSIAGNLVLTTELKM